MVAPSLNYNQIESSFASFPQANINTDISNPFTANYEVKPQSVTFSGSVTDDVTYFVELIFTGGPINATNTSWFAFLRASGSLRDVLVGLGSGPGNYKLWAGSEESKLNFRLIDLAFDSQLGSTISVGTNFDITAVDRIRFQFRSSGNRENDDLIQIIGIPFYWANSSGAAIVGGDSQTPLSFSYLVELRRKYIEEFSESSYITYTNILTGTDFIQSANAILYGDETTTAIAPGGLLLFSLEAKNTNFSTTISSNLLASGFVVGFSGLIAPDYVFRGNGLPYFWRDDGGGNTWLRLSINDPTTVDLGQSSYASSIIQRGNGFTIGGVNVAMTWELSTAPTIYIWNGTADLRGSIFNPDSSDYGIDFGDGFISGSTFDASQITFTVSPAVKKFRLNAAGKTLNVLVGETGFTEADFEVVAGTLVVITPKSFIRFFGIPDVPNAILFVHDLDADTVLFPPIINGEAQVEVDELHSYKVRADAPGYLSSRFSVIPGTTPQFEFVLEDFRSLYNEGINRSDQVVLNMTTFEVVISDTRDLTFADVFRTLEDYLSSEQGILLPFPPVPTVIELGSGRRNYLFFPYDTDLQQVNPVRIKPNPSNTSDPTLLDFVIVLVGADATLFDIFDFSGAGGRSIRFQTDAVATTSSGSSPAGLTTAQAEQLADLHATLEERGVFAASSLVNVNGTPSSTESSRIDINLIARAEEGVNSPQSIQYRELVFCPDASGGGAVFVGQRDGSAQPVVT